MLLLESAHGSRNDISFCPGHQNHRAYGHCCCRLSWHPIHSVCRNFKKCNLFFVHGLLLWGFLCLAHQALRLWNQHPVIKLEWRTGNWNFPCLKWCHLRETEVWISYCRKVSCSVAPISLLLFSNKQVKGKLRQQRKTMSNHPQR